MKTFGNLPFGRRIGADQPSDLLGTVNVLTPATPESVKAARRFFPEINERDLEREGKAWIDKGSGRRYRRVTGAPLAGNDPRRQADVFVLAGDCLLFLQREGVEAQVEVVEVGLNERARGDGPRTRCRRRRHLVRPWWETHPKEFWTPEDQRAAERAGVVPTCGHLNRPINNAPSPPVPQHLLPAGFTSFPPRTTAVEARSKQVDRLLAKVGIR